MLRPFWDLAQAAYDPRATYGNPAASNALMAVIAANDPVCLHLGHRQPRGESHAEAAKALRQACKSTQWEREAAEKSRQLLAMLRQKTAVQYLGKPLPGDTIAMIMKQAQRFMEWAADILPSAESLAAGHADTSG